MINVKFATLVKLAVLMTILVALDIGFIFYKFVEGINNGLLMPEVDPLASVTIIVMSLCSWVIVAIKEENKE